MRATAQAAAGQSRACIRAARRFKRRERGPLFLSEWERALFVHFRVPPGRLQTQVPFELDLLDGWAHVSLVAFEMRDLRLSFAGKLGRLLTVPGATHGLLNVRTYVTYRGEPGIHFMMEWIPNRLSILIGPRTYGLPYRFGRLEYDHDHEIGTVRGTVTPGGARGRLQYRATLPPSARYAVAEAGSMGDFLLERYTAFTSAGHHRRLFRIWHDPWRQTEANVVMLDDSALGWTGPWFRDAELIGAQYSSGVSSVRIGRPHQV